MVNAYTAKTARIKQETRERLVSEAEARLGFTRDHPEDEEVVNTTCASLLSASWELTRNEVHLKLWPTSRLVRTDGHASASWPCL
jgi:uncharacterized protein YdiU (UPF0061 family)